MQQDVWYFFCLIITFSYSVLLFGMSREDMLLCAAELNNVSDVQKLLAAGVSPHVQRPDGEAMMHIAAGCGYIKIVELALQYGADKEQKTRAGSTPLAYAACNGRIDAVQYLLLQGAEVDPVDDVGKTPLMHVTISGHQKILHVLLAHGANVEIRDHTHNKTALLHAVAFQNTHAVRALLHAGASLEALDKRGTNAALLGINSIPNQQFLDSTMLSAVAVVVGASWSLPGELEWVNVPSGGQVPLNRDFLAQQNNQGDSFVSSLRQRFYFDTETAYKSLLRHKDFIAERNRYCKEHMIKSGPQDEVRLDDTPKNLLSPTSKNSLHALLAQREYGVRKPRSHSHVGDAGVGIIINYTHNDEQKGEHHEYTAERG